MRVAAEPADSLTPLPGRVSGVNTELHEDGAFTNFDLFLRTDTPDGAGIQLDIEIQQNESGSNIEERGAYYEARMTSTQKGRYFTGTDYGRLVRSYSIWIVINPYAKWRETIRQIRKVMEVLYPQNTVIRPEDIRKVADMLETISDPREIARVLKEDLNTVLGVIAVLKRQTVNA